MTRNEPRSNGQLFETATNWPIDITVKTRGHEAAINTAPSSSNRFPTLAKDSTAWDLLP